MRHFTTFCMGSCCADHKAPEMFAATKTELFPIKRILTNTREHLEYLTKLRRNVEKKGKSLLKLLKEMSDPEKYFDILNSGNPADPSLNQKMFLNMIKCEHETIEGTPEQKEKVLKNYYDKLVPCKLCRFYTSLCFLKFKAGFASFHATDFIDNNLMEFVKYLLKHHPTNIKGFMK